MKKTIYFLLVLMLAGTSACGTSGTDTPKVSEADLLHHRFITEIPEGGDFPEPVAHIEFTEGMMLVGRICNNFRGQAELKDGILTMKQGAATMMLCPDPARNQFEQELFAMLHDGARVTRQGDTLSLERDGKTLRFTLSDPAK